MVAGQGTLTLNPGCINKLKAKDRQAADILMDAGLIEVHWVTNENDIKQYLCPSISCKELFSELYLLKNHFFTIHKNRPFKCTFNGCRWSFNTRSRLERHKNSHFNIREFKCETCGKMFSTMFNVRQHLKNIHERGEKYPCDVEGCDAGFHNQRNLDLHKATHENTELSYSCDQEGCNKTFVTKNALCSHMRSHEHDPEDLRCSWKGCNKVFEIPCRLKEHMRVHTGEKPYKCDHPGCGWSFYTGSKLQRHRAKHLQIRKYLCTIDNCNKSFFRSQHLKEHELTHAKKRPKKYPCPKEDCDCKFEFKRQLFLHMKKSHKKEKSAKQLRRERKTRRERREREEIEELEERIERMERRERRERKEKKERKEREEWEEREIKKEKEEIEEIEEGVEIKEEKEEMEKTHPKNKLHNYFEMKTFDTVQKDKSQPQFNNSNESINQLDTDNLLTGDYDVSPTENVPLNTHMPELVSSELLVAMNSIESPNNDPLPDLSPLHSCSNHSLLNTTPEETNNNEAVVINDNNVQFDHSSSPNKFNNKRKSGNSGSARTNYTYKDILREKNSKIEQQGIKRIKWLYSKDLGNDEPKPKILKNMVYSKQSEDLQNCKFSIPSDLVLGPGMSDHHSLIVQDELYTQEDLQVLLLDQSTLKNSIFEPSTINLRDLE